MGAPPPPEDEPAPETARGVLVDERDLIELLNLLQRYIDLCDELRREAAPLRAIHRRLTDGLPTSTLQKTLDYPLKPL